MNAQILVGLASSAFGGALVAFVTYLSTRKRIAAETRKLDAEVERTKAETTKMLSEIKVSQKPRTPGGAVPRGWGLSGNYRDDYSIGTDPLVAHSGERSGFIASRPDPRGFGTLMQAFKADHFIGRRLCLSAFIKTVGVDQWAGLWMRIDGPDEEALAIDNMEDRPIRGTIDWRQYRVVLDVPETSKEIAFGVLLEGEGRVWIDDVTFEAVDDDTPTTGIEREREPLPLMPRNLDFSFR